MKNTQKELSLDLKVVIDGMSDLNTYLLSIKEKLEKDLTYINTIRARAFREYTIESVSKNELGLKPLSPITKALTGEHAPENLTGKLVHSISVKTLENEKAAIVGYMPETDVRIGRLTALELANLQHSGFRILKSSEAYKKIRAFLGAKGVLKKGYKSNSRWMIVPPRPFLFIAANKYEYLNNDIKVVEDYLRQI